MSSFVPGAVGDNKPILKCNAKSGRFTVDDTAVTQIQFIADLENAEAGWMLFREGSALDFRLVKVRDLLEGVPYPEAPEGRDKDGKPLYKRGFRMMVKIGDKLAGGKPSIREMACSSFAVTTAIDGLLRAWHEQFRQNGKLPVVEVKDWVESKTQYGTNYQPQFLIKKLIDRPADLAGDDTTPAAPSHVTDVTGAPEVIDEDAPEDFSEFEAA